MKPIARLLHAYFTLGAIIGPLPNNITNGQAVDAVPVMANFNYIVAQVNANAAVLTTTAASIAALTTTVNGYGARASFTPAVAFGGASVGLTYFGQVGYQFPLQNAVLVVGSVSINNKGSSVGAMTVTGFPQSAALTWPTGGYPIFIDPIQFAIPSNTGAISAIGSIAPGTGTMQLLGPTGSTASVNSFFNQLDVVSGSAFTFMGIYPTS